MSERTLRKALFQTREDNNSVRCGLCPHRCLIAENSFGACGARSNSGGELIASGYGAVSSLALDPIEKKPLNLFHPGKMILSVGGYGCNLQCRFCQNHEISQDTGGRFSDTGERESRVVSPEDLTALAVRTSRDGNIGVAYTYNEPLISYEYLYDCAKKVREAGLLNVIVTNGYINKEPLETLLPHIDAMNIDLKGFTESFYKSLGGSPEPVKETIRLAADNCHVEVTTLVIPGQNEEDIEPIARWLSSVDPDIALHLSRFFPRYQYSDKEPTPRETIIRLRETAKKYLKNVFAGNMH